MEERPEARKQSGDRPAPEPAADLSERILAEATRLFVERGYYGISMREIAEAVGTTKAAIYYHYRDKEDLLVAILRSMLVSVERIILQAQAEGGTARAQIDRMMRAIFAMPVDQRALIRLFSQETAHLDPAVYHEFVHAYHSQFIQRIGAVLQAGIERGELAAVDPGLATWMLLGMAYPFFYPAHARELGASEEALALMIRIFFDGLAAE